MKSSGLILDNILTAAEFDEIARKADILSYRQIFLETVGRDGAVKAAYYGCDKFPVNVENLYSIRGALESPVLQRSLEDPVAAIEPADLQALKEKITQNLGAVAWPEKPLTPDHILIVKKLADDSLRRAFELVSGGLPESLTWEFEEPDAARELAALQSDYRVGCFNRLMTTFADVLNNEHAKLQGAKIRYTELQTLDEFAFAHAETSGGIRKLEMLSGPARRLN